LDKVRHEEVISEKTKLVNVKKEKYRIVALLKEKNDSAKKKSNMKFPSLFICICRVFYSRLFIGMCLKFFREILAFIPPIVLGYHF
jgi:hypothetical protein